VDGANHSIADKIGPRRDSYADDPGVFSQARVVLGTVQLPNGADIAPDAMYDAIRENSIWVME
jgi:hypothetical protein